MKVQYYAWKDRQYRDGHPEWIEITAKEYFRILAANKDREHDEKRYFAFVPAVEADDYNYYLECTHKEFLKSRAEKDARTRQRKKQERWRAENCWFDLVSLDQEMQNNHDNGYTTLHDCLKSQSKPFTESVEESIDLHQAIRALTDEEQELIHVLYFSGSDPVSVREYARTIGVPQQTINARKQRIFEKLRKFIGNC